MLVLVEGGKLENREGENQQTQLSHDFRPELNPVHIGIRLLLCAIPSHVVFDHSD